MISEVHAGGINSATYATEKERNLVAPETKTPANTTEQNHSQNTSPAAIVSLGNAAKSELLTYSKQGVLANARPEKEESISTISDVVESTTLAAEPEVTSAFGGTKKPPP